MCVCVCVSARPHPPVEGGAEEALSAILILEDLREVSVCVFVCDVGAPFFEGQGLVGALHVCVDVGVAFARVCMCVFLGLQPVGPFVEVVVAGVGEVVVCECVCDLCASFSSVMCPSSPSSK